MSADGQSGFRFVFAPLVPTDDAIEPPKRVANRFPLPEQVDATEELLRQMYWEAPVAVRVHLDPQDAAEQIDLPWTESDVIYELIESLYILHGWEAIDQVLVRLHAAQLKAILAELGLSRHTATHSDTEFEERLDQLASKLSKPERSLQSVVIAEWHKTLRRLASERSWPVVLLALEVSPPPPDVPDALSISWSVQSIDSSPALASRLYSHVILAVERARLDLIDQVNHALAMLERSSVRLLQSALLNARSQVLAEAYSYLEIQPESAAALLDSVKREVKLRTDESQSAPLTSFSGTFTEKAEKKARSAVPDARVKALQEAIKTLVPEAQEIRTLTPLLDAPPTSERHIAKLIQIQRERLAVKAGKLSATFPIVPQLTPTQIVDAARADPLEFATLIGDVLSTAYRANKAIRARVDNYGLLAEKLAQKRYPDYELAAMGQARDHSKAIWWSRKYIERGMRECRDSLGLVAGRVFEGLTARVEASTASAAQQHSLAAFAGEGIAIGGAAKFATRMLPVFNVALAAWHITDATSDYLKHHDEFYCTLDPRDALVDAAPSFSSLAANVALEVAFAVV